MKISRSPVKAGGKVGGGSVQGACSETGGK